MPLPLLKYLIATPNGILYLALKLSKPPLKSTKWENLPIPKKGLEVLRRLREIRGEKKEKTKKIKVDGKNK